MQRTIFSPWAARWLAALVFTLSPCHLVTLSSARADDDLDDLQEKAIKTAVRKVAPCVVQIETSGGTEVVQMGPRGLLRTASGPTSGLIVHADGYVISSAFNFASKPAAIHVSVPGHKERYVAEVVANDQTRMLTLLKLVGVNGKLPVPVAAPKKEMRIGQTALAVGRTLTGPADQMPSVSVGILSALHRIWDKAIQTDAKVSPTNYGGPLIDLYGRVQGVLVPASPRSEGETAGFEWYDSGIGFAIPLEDVNRVLPRLLKGTKETPVTLKRGLLGITLKQAQDAHDAPATIGTVSPGSAAEKRGLKAGDTIKDIDGKPIVSQAQLQQRLGPKYEGDVIALKVQRGKEEIKFDKVVLEGAVAAYRPAVPRYPPSPRRPRAGRRGPLRLPGQPGGQGRTQGRRSHHEDRPRVHPRTERLASRPGPRSTPGSDGRRHPRPGAVLRGQARRRQEDGDAQDQARRGARDRAGQGPAAREIERQEGTGQAGHPRAEEGRQERGQKGGEKAGSRSAQAHHRRGGPHLLDLRPGELRPERRPCRGRLAAPGRQEQGQGFRAIQRLLAG